MKTFKFLITSLLMASSLAFGHGEDKPGPHGGVIRMPGAFHTEVTIEDAKKFKIYLLDINFKNPITKNSSVDATFISDKTYQASCQVEEKAFVCHFEKEVLNGKGELQIKSNRDKAKGGLARYPVPLMKHH